MIPGLPQPRHGRRAYDYPLSAHSLRHLCHCACTSRCTFHIYGETTGWPRYCSGAIAGCKAKQLQFTYYGLARPAQSCASILAGQSSGTGQHGINMPTINTRPVTMSAQGPGGLSPSYCPPDIQAAHHACMHESHAAQSITLLSSTLPGWPRQHRGSRQPSLRIYQCMQGA
jgi:hypothetical protein